MTRSVWGKGGSFLSKNGKKGIFIFFFSVHDGIHFCTCKKAELCKIRREEIGLFRKAPHGFDGSVRKTLIDASLIP